MGEITDLVLEGILCEQCGCIMEDIVPGDPAETHLLPGPGHPRLCPLCLEEDQNEDKADASSA